MHAKFFKNISLTIILVASILVTYSPSSTAQPTGQKVLRFQDIEHIYDAVLVSNVSVAGNPIECGLFVAPPSVVQPITPFQAGLDWFQQMTISLVNRTNKIIVFAGLIFSFRDVGDCSTAHPCVGGQVSLGQMPAADAFTVKGQPIKPEHPERPPLSWKPRETIIVRVADYLPEIERNLVAFMPGTSLTNVNFYRGVVYFKDGMQWDQAGYAIPDPQRPGKYNKLADDYFPGKKGNNWPPGYDGETGLAYVPRN